MSMSSKKKLSSNDKYTPEDIYNLLEDYVEQDIHQIPLGSHIRYFQNINGQKKFRTGGKLKFNSGLPKFIILDNGKTSWSVQIKSDTVFFRKKTLKEIKDTYENEIDELEKKNDKLKNLIIELKKKIKSLENK